jgi:hypothetical protein
VVDEGQAAVVGGLPAQFDLAVVGGCGHAGGALRDLEAEERRGAAAVIADVQGVVGLAVYLAASRLGGVLCAAMEGWPFVKAPA